LVEVVQADGPRDAVDEVCVWHGDGYDVGQSKFVEIDLVQHWLIAGVADQDLW